MQSVITTKAQPRDSPISESSAGVTLGYAANRASIVAAGRLVAGALAGAFRRRRLGAVAAGLRRRRLRRRAG